MLAGLKTRWSARKPWMRSYSGHDLPHPGLGLRRGEGWMPVYEALHLDWIDLGTGATHAHWPGPADRVGARVKRAADRTR